jgi:hypothetical protein
MVDLAPSRLLLVPLTHDLIHASAEEKAVQATDEIVEMAMEDRTRWWELRSA